MRRTSGWLLVGLAILPSAILGQAKASDAITGPAHVVDGDTIDIGTVRIRLEGIDAPESKQTCNNARRREWDCGTSATELLNRLTHEHEVTCKGDATDTYGRRLATCFVAGRDINAEMIRNGLAWAFVRYSPTYVREEQEARKSKRGVFEVENTPPWDYRAAQSKGSQPTQSAGATPSCPIKGNISSKGEKIYHAPGQRDYEHVKISERNGERWFCSEAEATQAGWRKAAR